MSQPATSSLVSIRGLDFAYSDRLVLKHINLEIPRGTTLGMIGPNGGGKTTLIRLLVGLLRPTRGTIQVDGQSVRDAARCGDVIGYLPQRAEMNTQMPLSLRQLVGLCADGQATREHLDYLLQAVGLLDLAEKPIGSLSGGQLQRLLIARALARSPSLLVLDEPTTGIDASSREQFVALLHTLKRDLKLTVILSSHDLPTVHEVCDDVACVNVTLHVHERPLRHPANMDACGFPQAPAPASTSSGQG